MAPPNDAKSLASIDQSLETGVMPTVWIHSVVPLFKGGLWSSPGKYRSVCL